MNNHPTSQRLVGMILAIVVLASPLLAQQRRNAPKKPPAAEAVEPAPTFDSLLAADTFKVYCEVRGVGGLVRSPAVNDLLGPFMKLGRPPKEFKTLLKWVDAHAEALAGSRMMIAGWPSGPKLPNVIVAIEFPSPDEAKKFFPEFRDFLPTLLPPPPPVPASVSEGLAKIPSNLRAAAEEATTPKPPFQMRQAGSLVLISDQPFTFKNLKPRGSKPLVEDQNFLLARNRFASESVFLYVDLKSIEKEEKAQRQKWEEEAQKRAAEEAANPPKIEEKAAVMPDEAELPDQAQLPPPEPSASVSTELRAEVVTQPVVVDEVTPIGETRTGTDEGGPGFLSLYGAMFSGESKWPEAIGAALVVENDAYVIRTLILNSAENKGTTIPFVPQFVSGPPIVPQSPNVFPADTDFFISLSADYPQIYEGMLKAIANAGIMANKDSGGNVKMESPFAFYEKKLGLKIKDDLLPLLGNEMAMALGKKATKALKEIAATPAGPDSALADIKDQKTIPPDPIPVFAIATKDREAVGRLIPKIVEALGFKGANLLAQTEKRDGTEITTYGGAFSYAFIADFLVVSPDAAETRKAVDAYLKRETLASNSHFKNYTRWQPNQVLGQVYVGPDVMETYNPFGIWTTGARNVRTNDFLSRLSPLIEPTTYALSNDGSGPLHELHIPRNLLLWMIGASLSGSETSTIQVNEAASVSRLRNIYSAQTTFIATEGNGSYGTFDELQEANLISAEASAYGYKLDMTVSGQKFEAISVPVEYGVTGTLSYFIDESGVLRAGDHGGGAATAADQPVE